MEILYDSFEDDVNRCLINRSQKVKETGSSYQKTCGFNSLYKRTGGGASYNPYEYSLTQCPGT